MGTRGRSGGLDVRVVACHIKAEHPGLSLAAIGRVIGYSKSQVHGFVKPGSGAQVELARMLREGEPVPYTAEHAAALDAELVKVRKPRAKPKAKPRPRKKREPAPKPPEPQRPELKVIDGGKAAPRKPAAAPAGDGAMSEVHRAQMASDEAVFRTAVGDASFDDFRKAAKGGLSYRNSLAAAAVEPHAVDEMAQQLQLRDGPGYELAWRVYTPTRLRAAAHLTEMIRRGTPSGAALLKLAGRIAPELGEQKDAAQAVRPFADEPLDTALCEAEEAMKILRAEKAAAE